MQPRNAQRPEPDHGPAEQLDPNGLTETRTSEFDAFVSLKERAAQAATEAEGISDLLNDVLAGNSGTAQ